jgi:hypothetical protein
LEVEGKDNQLYEGVLMDIWESDCTIVLRDGRADHDWMIRMLEHRIQDKAFTGLIRKWLKAGIFNGD